MNNYLSIKFWKAAGNRAVRTMAQTAAALIGVNVFMSDVNWRQVLSASLLAGLMSVFTSVSTGLPEAGAADTDHKTDE